MVECSADCCVGDREGVKVPYKPRPAQHTPMSSGNPWTKIPTHMLSMSSLGSSGQVRAYSSDSNNDSAGGFGFQSLGSLFPAPPSPGRYSRPKERRAEEAVLKESEERAPKAKVQTYNAPDASFLKPTSPPDDTKRPKSDEVAAIPGTDSAVLNAHGDRPLVRRVDKTNERPSGFVESSSQATPRGRRERGPVKRPQTTAKPRAPKERKVSNPFATMVKKVAPSDKDAAATGSDSQAWGLSQEDQDTLDSRTDPSGSPATGKPSNSPELANAVKSAPATASGATLTHVKSSGEAHMVDVGAKPSTKRTAIAVAHIGLGTEVYNQIVENNNKKGDVLGIARIAGIMAAKRTSDIIPLCHPLAISKAEVDVYLVPAFKATSKQRTHYWSHSHPTGVLVAIQARVECVGPTGVEMEALMAVQGAALTIIDMCKAVSKKLTINGAKVVYKAGGRSGVYSDERWSKRIGEDKFTDSGELKEGVDVLLRLTS
jgi:molybdenum cofactor biosynthesis protein MoaC